MQKEDDQIAHESILARSQSAQQMLTDFGIRHAQAKTSIRASEYAQLVAQGKILEQKVPMRGQGRPERSDHPEGVTHRP
jgi:hypothetical protein